MQHSNTIWLDNLRMKATFMVVLLHVAAPGLYQFGKIENSLWWVCNIYDALVRCCVPLFVMISGALILNRDYELKDFLEKRLLRVLIPFIAWTFIYMLFNSTFQNRQYDWHHIPAFLFFSPAHYHLWFVFMIISLYLATPVLRKWLKQADDKEIQYVLLIAFIASMVNPFFKKWMNVSLGFHLQFFAGYTGYYILGYYLANRKVNISSSIAVVFFLIGFLITALATYWLSASKNKFDAFFFEYLTPNVLLMSVGVFMLFKNRYNTYLLPKNVIDYFNATGLGIYFIHVIFLVVLNKYGFNHLFIHPLVSVPAISVIALLVSSACIYTIQKIQYGKYLCG